MDFNCFPLLLLVLVIAVAYAQNYEEGELNSPCVHFSDCNNKYNVQRYFCSKNRTCQCVRNYLSNRSNNKCVGILEEICKYDDQCIEGAYCKNNKRCECKEDLIPTIDRRECSNSSKNTLHSRVLIVYPLVMFVTFLRIHC